MNLLLFLGTVFLLHHIFSKKRPKKNYSIDWFKSPTSKSLLSKKNKQSNYLDKMSVSQTIKMNDDSIIDVSNEGSDIPKLEKLIFEPQIPELSSEPISSYTQFYDLSLDQKSFYQKFKLSFETGKHYYLEGYDNYAKLLLYNYINDWRLGEKYSSVNFIKELIYNYPVTRSQAQYFIDNEIGRLQSKISTIQKKPNSNGISNVIEPSPREFPTYYDYWNLGDTYRVKLNLNDKQYSNLKSIYKPSTKFCEIEFCLIQIIHLYLDVCSQLEKVLAERNLSLDKVFKHLKKLYSKREVTLWSNDYDNYVDFEHINIIFYRYVFRLCEKNVRVQYSITRKINPNFIFLDFEKTQDKYNSQIGNLLAEIVIEKLKEVEHPDNETERKLNELSRSRWKFEFEKLKKQYAQAPKHFYSGICELVDLNNNNPSSKKIFFEASKFISKTDKLICLKLYTHYVYHDLRSPKVDNKQLSSSLVKKLFNEVEYLENFKMLVKDLKENQKLEEALKRVDSVFKKKRKTFTFNSGQIEDIKKDDKETAEKLGEYLDDYEEEVIEEKEIRSKPTEPLQDSISLNPLQKELINLFVSNEYFVEQNKFKEFAKSKNKFANSLLGDINEFCYDVLEDVLIEEEEDGYRLEETYLQQLNYVQ